MMKWVLLSWTIRLLEFHGTPVSSGRFRDRMIPNRLCKPRGLRTTPHNLIDERVRLNEGVTSLTGPGDASLSEVTKTMATIMIR